ncbi:unnamed protein product [Blepharisma stoltei]|uniref:Peptidase M20 dimerisation domain-containing protein n=1 Tax=Blepharisma stoltei TaxID=1481888 RepID=A0AAU9JMY2_9CILI|nr:unnamed protein product [Blepharisma stoltei]
MKPVTSDPVQIILNRTYRPTLSILGCQGIPSLENAGSLLRPSTSLRLSVRLPPTVDCNLAAEKLVEALTRDPPYGAHIEIKHPIDKGSGWKQNNLESWLKQALDSAGQNFFGTDCLFYNRGGSIPFLNLLGAEFPSAQFMVAGPASTDSNTHSANENFRIDYMKKILCCVSEVLYHHGRQIKTT